MSTKLYDVVLTAHVPITVVVEAKSKKEAKRIATDMYDDGELDDRVLTSFSEHNETMTCTFIERVD